MKFHRHFHCFIRHLYYSRITVTGADHVPADGPVLALCLHRNGAVDGFVYLTAIQRLTYLVRARLRRGLIGKLFFPGLDVTRSSDGGRGEDLLQMIGDCADALHAGVSLGIFPEGTSQLGPCHLPFQSGAARIAMRHRERGGPLTILPLGIHYECPWAFRSRVEVVVGTPISIPSAGELSKGVALRDIKGRFAAALEDVGINVPDQRTQDLLQKFAYVTTLGTGHRYFSALKSMEARLPPEAVAAWEQFEADTGDKLLLRHQGVPLFPVKMRWLYALLALLLAVPVLAGALLNLPPILVAWFCGKRFADNNNVIALWRILTGVPLFLLWAVGCMAVSIVLGHAGIAVVYLALTTVAIMGWYRLKKLAVAGWNGLLHPEMSGQAHAIHRLILRELEADRASTTTSSR